MEQGLFESLVGRFADGTPVAGVPAGQRRLRSVIDHLHRLFNTREGSLPHLQGYGLPDISHVYRTLPEGAEGLRDAMRSAVERYEPRLRKVKVVQQEADARTGRLVFLLSAQLPGAGQVRFQTTFTSAGESAVAQWKRAE